MAHVRTIVTGAMAAVLAIGLLATPALAAAPDREFGPIPDIVIDGSCAFPVLLHAPINNEYITTFYDRTGAPVRIHFAGRLVAEVSNQLTGTTVTINASGPGDLDPATGVLTGEGHYLQWLPGSLRLYRGQFTSDGQGTGSSIDVCAMLAG